MRPIEDPANARSRRTRAALLAATREIIEEGGFESLAMGEVARRAGVSRRGLYLHFASRSDLMNALFDYMADTEGLADSTRPVWDAPDAAAALDEWARHLGRYHPRLIPIIRALERVRRTDADAQRHRARVVQAQLTNCRRIIARLAEEGRLARPWTVDSATDMLWALISTDMIEGLLVDRAWTPGQFSERFSVLLRSTFVEGASGG